MANPFREGGSSKTSNPFLVSKRRTPNPFLPGGKDTAGEIAKLEKLNEETGARSIEQESPGLFSRIIDLASRGNYATVAAAQALLQGEGGTEAAKMAGREIFSGIGGIKGQKKGFGQVLEEQGVPELGSLEFSIPTPSAAARAGLPEPLGAKPTRPAPIKVTGRGTIGLGLDVFADPTTYVSFGSGAAVRIGKAGARKAITRTGERLLAKELAPALDELARAGIVGEERILAQRAARADAEARVLAAAETDPKLLDKGAIKFAGHTIPGTPQLATAASGVSSTAVRVLGRTKAGAAALEATRSLKPAYDAVGAVFNRDWHVRNLPAYVEMKQAHLDRHVFATEELHRAILDSAVTDVPKTRWQEFVDAMEDGTWRVKFSNDPKMLQAGQDFERFNQGWAQLETAAGMLPQTRANYVAHFYDNSPEEIARAVSAWGQKRLNLATMGRHAEERAFDTLKQAREITERLSQLDRDVAALRPVYNPMEILRRRGEAHVDALEFRRYYQEIRDNFAKQDLPFAPDDYFDLVRPTANLQPGEWKAVKDAVDGGATDIKTFLAFSKEGRSEFIRQRLLRTKDPLEIINVLNKYGLENAPRMRRLVGQLAEDGSPYVSFNLPLFKDLEVPKSIADDLSEMSEKVLKAREVNELLRWFDKGNNAFKSGVTLYFPAFHVRNAYSNVAMGFVDIGLQALNPIRHAEAINILRGAKGEFVTKLGERYSYDDLRKMIAELQVRVSGRSLLEHTAQAGDVSLAKGLGSKIKGIPRGIGGATETEARTQLFLTHLRRGMNPEQAAARTKEFLYDYSNMSRVEREWFSRAIPFYRFTRLNLERQLKNLAYRPGRVAAELKPFRGRQEENGQMTSWDGEALKLRLNRDGKTVRILSGVDMPMRNLDLLWKGSLGETGRNAASMLTPFFKAPIEAITQKNLFTGRDMTRAESKSIGQVIELLDPPKMVKDYFGYEKETDKAGRTRYSFDGERFYIWFQAWALSRAVSTSDRQFRALEESGWGPVILNVLTGLQDKTMNLDEENTKRLEQRRKQLEEAAIKRGTMKEFRRAYVPTTR